MEYNSNLMNRARVVKNNFCYVAEQLNLIDLRNYVSAMSLNHILIQENLRKPDKFSPYTDPANVLKMFQNFDNLADKYNVKYQLNPIQMSDIQAAYDDYKNEIKFCVPKKPGTRYTTLSYLILQGETVQGLIANIKGEGVYPGHDNGNDIYNQGDKNRYIEINKKGILLYYLCLNF